MIMYKRPCSTYYTLLQKVYLDNLLITSLGLYAHFTGPITTLYLSSCQRWLTKALVLEWQVNCLSRVDEEAVVTFLTSLSDQVVIYN